MTAPAGDEDSWLIDIKKDLTGSNSSTTGRTICRVPDRLRSLDKDAFSPQVISIGLLHHTEEHLLAMEQHKKQYTISLLQRTHDEMDTLEHCWNTTKSLRDEAGQCYEGGIILIVSDFSRMLLYDGCFILELFIRVYESDGRDHDPILTNPRMIPMLRHDLALFENQIPFIVLEQLFTAIKLNYRGRNKLPSLVHLALRFFKLDPHTYRSPRRDVAHLLDLIHDYCGSSFPGSVPSDQLEEWKIIKCATKLHTDALIEFKNEATGRLFAVKFDSNNGVMTVPHLFVEKSLLQNLIAMEQCLRHREEYITSYVLFMDYLVDTAQDVELLVQKGIIPHSFGDYAEVADLFNNICKQTAVRGFYFAGICKEVDGYCMSSWKLQKHKKTLVRDYFQTPWKCLGVSSAFILLVLTTVQTIYSILSYKKG